ncbi:MAG: glycyl-radical enzyme activating protein [Bacteroidales bacterium]
MDTQIKGLVYDIRSFSVNDGPGIRKTIFLKGCPLRCSWCHNPESFEFKPRKWLKDEKTGSYSLSKMQVIGKYYTPDEIIEDVVTDLPFFEQSSGGITLSGGEPLSQAEFAYQILLRSQQHDIHTCVDTSGFAPWQDIEKVASVTDLFLYDLKLANNDLHKKYTGRENRVIIENLMKLNNLDCDIHIRIPLVEGITDTSENLDEIFRIVENLSGLKRIDLLPYHTIAKIKYRRLNLPYNCEEMPEYPMEKAEKILQRFCASAEMVTLGG